MPGILLTDAQFEELKQVILDIPPPVQIIDLNGDSIAVLEYEGHLDQCHVTAIEAHFAKISKIDRCIILTNGIQLKQVLQPEAQDNES